MNKNDYDLGRSRHGSGTALSNIGALGENFTRQPKFYSAQLSWGLAPMPVSCALPRAIGIGTRTSRINPNSEGDVDEPAQDAGADDRE